MLLTAFKVNTKKFRQHLSWNSVVVIVLTGHCQRFYEIISLKESSFSKSCWQLVLQQQGCCFVYLFSETSGFNTLGSRNKETCLYGSIPLEGRGPVLYVYNLCELTLYGNAATEATVHISVHYVFPHDLTVSNYCFSVYYPYCMNLLKCHIFTPSNNSSLSTNEFVKAVQDQL